MEGMEIAGKGWATLPRCPDSPMTRQPTQVANDGMVALKISM